MLPADGPCLIKKALCKGDTLCIPVALGVVDKIAQVHHIKSAAGRQATASLKCSRPSQVVQRQLAQILRLQQPKHCCKDLQGPSRTCKDPNCRLYTACGRPVSCCCMCQPGCSAAKQCLKNTATTKSVFCSRPCAQPPVAGALRDSHQCKRLDSA